jgi:hypothetical protein
MPEVSLAATLTGTLAAFALGALWYGPLFGRAWMAALGKSQAELLEGFNPALTYGLTFLLALASAYGFGAVFAPVGSPATGLAMGAVVGLVWVGASIATNDLFQRSSLALWLINAGYHTVRFMLVGLVFGWLG